MKNRDLWDQENAHLKSKAYLAWAVSNLHRARAQGALAGYSNNTLAIFDMAIGQCLAITELTEDR